MQNIDWGHPRHGRQERANEGAVCGAPISAEPPRTAPLHCGTSARLSGVLPAAASGKSWIQDPDNLYGEPLLRRSDLRAGTAGLPSLPDCCSISSPCRVLSVAVLPSPYCPARDQCARLDRATFRPRIPDLDNHSNWLLGMRRRCVENLSAWLLVSGCPYRRDNHIRCSWPCWARRPERASGRFKHQSYEGQMEVRSRPSKSH